ncbi:MAG: CCA tRNA nucleotidyltransferase [Parasporobacterium sp.]|nr:CCA tRNA nucleotidyltransferase [Parasporobacterium sp.]
MNDINNFKIDIPYPVRDILNTLKSNGHEAYIVGGCVRDALLGREPEDWDITTSALPSEVKSLFHSTVDTGIQHGTVMVIRGGEGYEVTTYRVDGEYRDGRHPESVTFTRSLAEDLKRRDFTINAFAWDEDGLKDMFDGISDLEQGIIRCVGNPDERFNEDALRIMRAVRFSAQLGFKIEPETRGMISKHEKRLSDVSMERIRVEFEKTLLSGHPEIVDEYAELGLGRYITGEVHGKCFDRNAVPVLRELLRRRTEHENVLKAVTDDPAGTTSGNEISEMYRQLSMAAFFHKLTPEETGRVFRYMKYDNRTRDAVVRIIEYKDTALTSDRAGIKRQLNKMGASAMKAVLEYKDAVRHVYGKTAGEHLPEYDTASDDILDDVKGQTDDILRSGEPWSIAQLAVSGSDLIAAGIPAGKKIGETLEKILQKVIQSPTLNTKEKLSDSVFLREMCDESRINL